MTTSSIPVTGSAAAFADPARLPQQRVCVDIVIPVLNEEHALPGCVRTLHAFLSESFPYPWRITIADNGSTDATWERAIELTEELDAVAARRLDIRGRGAALKAAWSDSTADIVAYMDVDLSTDLGALLPLIAPLASGHSGVAIGTRLGKGARVRRGLKRDVISRCYNLMLRYVMGVSFSDAQCGFKAGRAEIIRPLIGMIHDDGFFFDTELLLLADYNGLRVHEVPVDWVEDVDSRVNIWRTTRADLLGSFRMMAWIASGRARAELAPLPELRPMHPEAALAPPQSRVETLARVATFSFFGLVSTALFIALYSVLRQIWAPALANLGALTVASIFNTEVNRRWTFNRTDGPRLRQHFRAGILFALYYASTTGAVLGLRALDHTARRGTEIAVILGVSVIMTAFRYVALDRWAFGRG